MEIFSEEFKIELSNQLEALTNLVKTDKPKKMSDLEIKESMEDSFTYDIKKERNKNNKKFQLEDVVYLGNLQGRVTNIDDFVSVKVNFINGYEQWFNNNGSLAQNSPKVLSHYPYELKKKKSKH
jgi:hypothetical protein